ncbi:MAG: hypothetical protein ACRD2G_17810, partial [Terriglobia bacterium]
MRLHHWIAILFLFAGALAPLVLGQAVQTGQAQTAPAVPMPVRDPQAVILLSQALARLRSDPVAVSDVTLTASATYTAGSDHETGTATLRALGTAQSRVMLNLDNGQREEVRNGVAGAWVGADGAAHPMATHNCWVDANWFYPLLTLEAASADPTISVTLAGQTTVNGEAVEDLILSRIVPHQGPAITIEIQKLSAVHLYLDASTLLPVELDFNVHPDKNANRDIPVGIQFSNYHAVSGVLVPFHIQKYLQHSLLLDLQVS